jgi:hypothetical protein
LVEHIKILAIVHIAWSLMWLLTGVMTIVVMTMLAAFMFALGDAEVASAVMLLVFGLLFGFAYVLLAIPGIVGGLGLLKGYGWARIPVFLAAVLSLSSFPYGIALIGYTYFVLLDEDVRRELAGA